MILLFAITAQALAGGGLNCEPSVRVGVIVVPGAAHPVGVELGANFRFALVDQCPGGPIIPPPTDCYHGWIWPTSGPTALLSWRGGTRWGGFVGPVGGVGTADVHDCGFFPLWSLDARLGLAGEVGDGAGLSVGLEAAIPDPTRRALNTRRTA